MAYNLKLYVFNLCSAGVGIFFWFNDFDTLGFLCPEAQHC